MRRLLPGFALASCLACEGQIQGGVWPDASVVGPVPTTPNPSREDAGAATACQADANAGHVRVGADVVRRLSASEYRATVRALTGVEVAQGFPAEPRSDGFDNQSQAQTPSLSLIEAYAAAAERVASQAAPALAANLACGSEASPACGESFVQSFGPRFLRHPLSADEMSLLSRAFQLGAQRSITDGVRVVIQTALQSAPFLYRIEIGTPATAESQRKLDAWELATRLSYLMTSEPPDDQLLDAARNGTLLASSGFAAERDRLARDERAKPKLLDFYDQWLSLRLLPEVSKSAGTFPEFTKELPGLLKQQATRFLEEITWHPQGAGLEELLTGHFTFVSPTLAAVYGYPPPAADGLTRVELDVGQSSGLLSLAGFLALQAKADSSSPIHRGKFIREELLCQPLPAPPNDVPPAPEISDSATTRERFAQHTQNPACSGCHQLIDPLGLPLEEFDGIGRLRSQEAGKPLDLSGKLSNTDVDGDVNGVQELGEALARSANVQRCVTTKFFRFAAGRAEAADDACHLAGLDEAFSTGGFDLSRLPVAYASLPEFGLRRWEEP